MPALTSGMEAALPSLQREVQRKLGCCTIRLQQYERLMKALVANMAVEGAPEQLHTSRELQVACASAKTLGTLIGMFTGSYLHWPNSTIVDCLRNAEQVCASTIAFIRLDRPEQAPAKYGCKNWRQVLKKSEQFEMRTGADPLNAGGKMLYRSREEATLSHRQAS